MPWSAESLSIDTPRGRFHLRRAGPADAPVLVLLHGWPQSSYCWRPVAERLASRFRLLMPDLRGLGDSLRSLEPAAYLKQALAADVLGLLDALGIERFGLVGHDWGGAVAQEMALAAPARVARLALANIHVLPNARGNAAAREQIQRRGAAAWWYQFFQSATGLPEAMIPGNERPWLAYFLKTWSAEGLYAEAFEEYVRCYAIEHTPATGAAYYRCYKQDSARWAELAGARFAMPGLYIHGRHDPVIIPEFTAHLDDVFDQVELQSLDAAHFVAEERPDEVAAALREFFADLLRARHE